MKNPLLKSIGRKLTTPLKTQVFLYLLLLNIVSNAAVAFNDASLFAMLSIASLAAVIASLEAALYLCLKWKPLQYLHLGILILFYNVLIVTEYFNALNFQAETRVEIIEIITDTNAAEISNFASTYLQPGIIAMWVCLAVLGNILLLCLARLISRVRYLSAVAALLVAGVCVLGAFSYSLVRYHDGLKVTQYTSLTRISYSFLGWFQKHQAIADIRANCQATQAKQTIAEKPNIILVIGESASVYHSQLYGYDKPTTPHLVALRDSGELIVMNDVVSPGDATSETMYAIYPLKSIQDSPLFPACFKAAGYHTVMYNNQYFINNGMNFLSDPALSAVLFDYRNTKRYRHDLEMVNDIKLSSTPPSLYIIQLWGQHYTYSERYPDSFRKFTAADYDESRWNEKQREIIAHYDNATLYNDSVICAIINKFRSEDCCIIYMSDHGEEVYELRNFMGHGSAPHSPDLSYQVRVPMYVWVSPTFSRPEITEKFRALCQQPLITANIQHTLLDIAGIQTKDFNPTRSMVNDQYDSSQHRIVLGTTDYDEYVSSKN